MARELFSIRPDARLSVSQRFRVLWAIMRGREVRFDQHGDQVRVERS